MRHRKDRMNHKLKLPVIRTWQAWGEVFTDVAVWAPAVREICRRAGLPCRTIEAGYPGTNAVFIVNRASGSKPDANSADAAPFVVKIYAPFCLEDFRLECELHPLLAKVPELNAPRLLGAGELDAGSTWRYLLLSFLPGRPIREVRKDIPSDQLQDLAHELGRRLHALHSVPITGLRELDAARSGWEDYVATQIPRTVKELRRESTLPAGILADIPDFVRSTAAADRSAPLVLVNGDVTEDHLLLERGDGTWTISGLIDFADSRVAPRAYEWIALWFGAFDRDPRALQAFMTGYDPQIELDAGFYRRAMAYTFLHEFGALIIDMVLEKLARPPVETIAELQRLLWRSAV